jgi:hypothetical protein
MRALFATIARIGDRQHGRISREQLLAAGVDRNRISRWIADGRLRRVHVGIYAVGHVAASVDGDYMAAVLAGGPGAVLSHRAAAYKLGLLRGAPRPPEVTIPTTAHRRRPGIVIHRVSVLHVLDTAMLDAIPITIVPRTVLDLAPATKCTELTRICHEAWIRHRTTPEQIAACVARNPAKPGARQLRDALGTDVTLSFLEDAFLALLTTHGLPRPRTNIDHRGDKVDCHWPDLDLTIELLSYRFHATRQAFEHDVARRRRSRHLAYTYGDVTQRGAQTAAELRPLLTRPVRTPTAPRRSPDPDAGRCWPASTPS